MECGCGKREGEKLAVPAVLEVTKISCFFHYFESFLFRTKLSRREAAVYLIDYPGNRAVVSLSAVSLYLSWAKVLENCRGRIDVCIMI